jgi:hypothetical protein
MVVNAAKDLKKVAKPHEKNNQTPQLKTHQ